MLPLANLSKDPEQEFFADGMTEALITELAKVGSLRVISRTSVMQFKGTTKALPQIARELAVDAVVEGSVQRAGSQVRITAQHAVDLAGGTSATVAQLAHVYGVAGRRDQAERLLADLVARSKREYVSSYWIALVHHGLGQEEQALARLETALEQREAMPLLEVEPRWDSLRSDPRFQALLRRTWERSGAAP